MPTTAPCTLLRVISSLTHATSHTAFYPHSYTRVSAQMYNYKAEYYAFASAVLRVQGLEVPSDVAREAESWRASRSS